MKYYAVIAGQDAGADILDNKGYMTLDKARDALKEAYDAALASHAPEEIIYSAYSEDLAEFSLDTEVRYYFETTELAIEED